MPAWIADLLTVPAFVSLGVLLAVGWFAHKAWPTVRKISHFVDDVSGEPARPGQKARPGLMERISAVEEKVDTIHHETRPNGGGSMNDAVRRIEATQRRESEVLKNQVELTAEYLPKLQELHDKYSKDTP